MKSVSIITTFYNSENFISSTLNSVNQQIYNHNDIYIEYILVNDCSTDNSLNIVNDFIKNNQLNVSFKVFTTESNVGCGVARKFGIDKSIGKYLMFIDADDYYLHNDFISRAVNDIDSSNADIIEYGVRYHQMNGEYINHNVKEEIVLDDIPDVALKCLFKENIIKVNVWSKIIRKSITQKIPYSTIREFEDVDTIPKWVEIASKIIIKPTVEINYRISSNSIINKNMNKTRYLTLQTLMQYFEKYKNNRNILLAIYDRALIDLKYMLKDKTSDDEMFDEFSELNTKILSYIYPETYQNFTYNVEK